MRNHLLGSAFVLLLGGSALAHPFSRQRSEIDRLADGHASSMAVKINAINGKRIGRSYNKPSDFENDRAELTRDLLGPIEVGKPGSLLGAVKALTSAYLAASSSPRQNATLDYHDLVPILGRIAAADLSAIRLDEKAEALQHLHETKAQIDRMGGAAHWQSYVGAAFQAAIRNLGLRYERAESMSRTSRRMDAQLRQAVDRWEAAHSVVDRVRGGRILTATVPTPIALARTALRPVHYVPAIEDSFAEKRTALEALVKEALVVSPKEASHVLNTAAAVHAGVLDLTKGD